MSYIGASQHYVQRKEVGIALGDALGTIDDTVDRIILEGDFGFQPEYEDDKRYLHQILFDAAGERAPGLMRDKILSTLAMGEIETPYLKDERAALRFMYEKEDYNASVDMIFEEGGLSISMKYLGNKNKGRNFKSKFDKALKKHKISYDASISDFQYIPRQNTDRENFELDLRSSSSRQDLP